MFDIYLLRQFPLNIQAIKAKIKLPKQNSWHGNILNAAKKNLSRPALKLTLQEKIEFEVAHILLKMNVSSHFKQTRVLSLLQGLTLIF